MLVFTQVFLTMRGIVARKRTDLKHNLLIVNVL